MLDKPWVTGEEVEFEVLSEGFNYYKLEDGTILKVKYALVKVLKTDKKDPEGNNQYIINGRCLVTTTKIANIRTQVNP